MEKNLYELCPVSCSLSKVQSASGIIINALVGKTFLPTLQMVIAKFPRNSVRCKHYTSYQPHAHTHTHTQLSPFPYDQILRELDRYPHAELVWAQEEPKNMGAWSYVQPRLSTTSGHTRKIRLGHLNLYTIVEYMASTISYPDVLVA